MTNATLITLCWELHEQGIPKSHTAQRLGKHRETVGIWIRAIEKAGLLGFLNQYQQAKKGQRQKRQVDTMAKRWVWAIRDREYGCCGQKIQYFPKLESLADPELAPSTIYSTIHGYSLTAITANSLAADFPMARQHIQTFLTRLRYIKPSLTGNDLQKMGITPGPRMKEILQRLHQARLDGKVTTKKDEEGLVRGVKFGKLVIKSSNEHLMGEP